MKTDLPFGADEPAAGACGMADAREGRRDASSVSGRLVCRYACSSGNVSALGTDKGTIGRDTVAVRLLGRERGSGGRSVQCAASTSACVAYSGTVAVGDDWAMNEAAVGVFGADGEPLDDDTARMCVGKADELGAFGVGRKGASIDGGRRARGSEPGIVSSDKAASILGQSQHCAAERKAE